MFETPAKKEAAKRHLWTLGATGAGWLIGGPIIGIPVGVITHFWGKHHAEQKAKTAAPHGEAE